MGDDESISRGNQIKTFQRKIGYEWVVYGKFKNLLIIYRAGILSSHRKMFIAKEIILHI